MLDQPGVTPTESPAVNEEAVNEETVETTTAETAPQEEPQTHAPQNVIPVPQTPQPSMAFDERGVPWQNVAMENQRKYQELAEKINKLEQVSQPKKYSIQELESFALQNPDHRPWVEEEKAKLLREQIEQSVTQRVTEQSRAKEAEFTRQQTFNEVINQFPDLAVRDQQGRFMGWNQTNPMTQHLARYYADPELAQRPNGLAIAAKLAYADYAMSQAPSQAKKVNALKTQVKKIQQQTFTEGGGKPVPSGTNPVRKAVENFRATGRSSDATAAMGAILRAQGLLKD